MGFPRFVVHQNSYEALKKFHDGWGYFGRGWIVGLLRSTIGALTDLLSAMTLYLGRSRASVEYSRAVSADSVHASTALGDDTAIRMIKCKTATAATVVVLALAI
jgi:hypothetical protein